MAALGLMLALFCVVQLPSAYQFQTKFNERSKKAREMRESKPTPNSQRIEMTRAQRSVIPIRC